MYLNQIKDLCQIYYSDLEQNNRQLIKPYQLDLVIPQIKLAIQFNGLKYHSQLSGTDKFYHQRKYQLCKNQNYNFFMIWDFQWKYSKQKIQNQLLSYLITQKKLLVNPVIKQEINSSGEHYLQYNIYENDTLVAIFKYLGHKLIEFTCNYMYDCSRILGFILDTLEIKRITKEIRCGQQNEIPYIKNGFKIEAIKNPIKKQKYGINFYDCGLYRLTYLK